MQSLKAAWGLLIGRPRFPVSDEDTADLPLSVPIAGFVLGLAAVAIAGLVAWAIPSRATASLLAAIGLPVLHWWATRAAGIKGMLLMGARCTAAVERGEGNPDLAWCWSTLIVQINVLLKVAALGLLVVSGRWLWIGLPMVVSAAVYAEFLPLPAGGSPESAPSSIKTHWLAGAVGALVFAAAGQMILSGAVAVAAAWLVVSRLPRCVAECCPEAREYAARATAECSETVLLVVGALLVLP